MPAENLLGDWDADRLSQVVSNLLGNAIQHRGPTPVTVTAREDDEHNDERYPELKSIVSLRSEQDMVAPVRSRPPMRSAVLATIFALAATSATGQQPFYTDDAGVTDAGVVHLEIFNEFDRLQPALEPHRHQNTFNMRATCGLGQRVEFNLDAPLLTILNSSQVQNVFGLGDTNVGVKYHWRDEGDGYRHPALALAVYLETPTGHATSGLGSGLTDIWVYGIAQRTVRPKLIVRGNLGYLFAGNTSTGVEGITTSCKRYRAARLDCERLMA